MKKPTDTEIRLIVPAEYSARLDLLVKDTGISDPAELFGVAVAFLEWGIQRSKQGRFIASIDDSTHTVHQVDFAVLRKVRTQNRKG